MTDRYLATRKGGSQNPMSSSKFYDEHVDPDFNFTFSWCHKTMK